MNLEKQDAKLLKFKAKAKLISQEKKQKIF